jgi:antitoxin component YwqK of YwqJK toxin-antitoxin module
MSHFSGAAVLKLFLKLLCILALLSVVACNQHHSDQDIEIKEDGLIYKAGQENPYTGRVIDTLKNNIIEYDVVKGLKNGEFRISTLEGIVSVVGNIEDNRNIGEWHYYYPNGQLESEGNFKNDMPHGKWIWYYSNGDVKEKGSFLYGVKVGDWYQYTRKGNVISVLTYINGKLVNEVKFSLSRDV